ncbi:MAG: HEAT repeat domain-containing protein [Methylacidiphilales bacterium]|nr:HEAT repeat domain-containing protein [Candidatus Methylacidiphilales bacterium]MDW8348677.1 HEAT repeat domain-containing protein [Verrucomicrobiae bacterium]
MKFHLTAPLLLVALVLYGCKSAEQKKREEINQRLFPKINQLIDEKNYTTAIETLRQAFAEDVLNPQIYPVLFRLLATIEKVDFIAGAIRDVSNFLIQKNKLPPDATPEYPPLIEAIEKNLNQLDPQQRIAIIRGLALYPAPWTFELIKAKIKDPVRDVRQAAVTALAANPTDAVLPILKEATKDEWWFVRAEAVSGLGRYRDESTPRSFKQKLEVIDHLFAMLHDVDSTVRYAAENGLLTLTTEKTKSHFDAVFRQGDEIKKRVAAICLASFQKPEVTAFLISTLPKVQDKDTQARIIRALGLSRDSQALPLLRSLLNQTDRDVRGEAIVALGLQADQQSLGRLQMIARDNNEPLEIRRAAQMAVGQITQALIQEQRQRQTSPSSSP